MRRVLVVLIAFVFVVLCVGRGNGATSSPIGIDAVVQRFLARPDEPLRQYRAIRHLDARNDRFNLVASLDAETELSPDGRFKYSIIRESGSDYIRRKVMKALLENEADMAASGDQSRYAVNGANYVVAGGESVSDGTVKLFAKPRRRDLGLIEGAVFVTSDDADIVRVEGRLVKTPSFWTTRVDLVRSYARIDGIRVPVRLDTTAHIRVAGVSTLSMTYTYEMLNGVGVNQ